MEDTTLKVTIIISLFGIGIFSIIAPHQINSYVQRLFIANEYQLRKIPILGLFIRDLILLQERPEGDILLRIIGGIIILLSVVLVFILTQLS